MNYNSSIIETAWPYVLLYMVDFSQYSILNMRVVYLQNAKNHLLDTESFDTTFGPKSHRKKPKTQASDLKVLCIIIIKLVYYCHLFLIGPHGNHSTVCRYCGCTAKTN